MINYLDKICLLNLDKGNLLLRYNTKNKFKMEWSLKSL